MGQKVDRPKQQPKTLEGIKGNERLRFLFLPPPSSLPNFDFESSLFVDSQREREREKLLKDDEKDTATVYADAEG